MPGRSSLIIAFLAVSLIGCATVSEERLSMLESAIMDLQANDMRLTSLEETVAALAARQELPEPQIEPEKPHDMKTVPAPRKSISVPAPQSTQASVPVSDQKVEEPVPVPLKPALERKITSARASGDYQAALAALESGRPQAAMGQFQNFLRNYPGHALTPNAGYWLGECYYSLKQYESAIMAFRDVVAQYPTHDKAAASMLKAGFSYAQLGDTANARFYLEALLKDYPSSPPASLARARLASL